MPKKHGNRDPSKTGVAYIQVLGLGTDTQDTLPSVLLFFEHQRLLFNAGEGFQRFCTQHRVRMTKLSSVFATRMSTEALGGVPGMVLTMADVKGGANVVTSGRTTLTLYGPPGITKLYNAMRTFINVRDLGLRAVEFDGTPNGPPIMNDKLFTLHPVVLTQEAAAQSEPAPKRAKVDDAHEDGQVADGEVLVEDHEAVAVSYVVELASVRGRFDVDKALALGVPQGTMFGELQRGSAVTTPDGRTVAPEEVLGPSTPGPVACIVDCPSEGFLPSLTASPTFARLQADTSERVYVLVHLSPAAVVALPAYQAWMASFGSTAQHIVVHHPTAEQAVSLVSSAVLHAQLHAVDTRLFPIQQPSKTPSDSSVTLPEGALAGLSLSRFTLLPPRKIAFETDGCDKCMVDTKEVIEAVQRQHAGMLQQLPNNATNKGPDGSVDSSVPACVRNAGPCELELVFLGTGAAVPSKYRNVTGTYLHLFDRGGMMIDCGEGSLGQLRRRFGAGCDEILARMQAVWISHIHADHHVGLPRLLNARKRLLGEQCPPLLVIGPRPLRRALLTYAQLEPMSFQYVDCANLCRAAEDCEELADATMPKEALEAAMRPVLDALQLQDLWTFPVVHCRKSYGLTVEGRSGWKIVFSGDTRPCAAVVEAAKGATLLVHEATFEDAMIEDAQSKRHCTISEAIAAGTQAGCYRTILTHFSARYSKWPVLEQPTSESVAVAFDLMSVNLQDLPRLPSLVPALQQLFEAQAAVDDAVAV